MNFDARHWPKVPEPEIGGFCGFCRFWTDPGNMGICKVLEPQMKSNTPSTRKEVWCYRNNLREISLGCEKSVPPMLAYILSCGEWISLTEGYRI
jgi:hypothetical protein